MSQAINRRQALTVVAAVPVGAALSTTAIASHSEDAELKRLWDEWNAQWLRWEQASDVYEEAYKKVREACGLRWKLDGYIAIGYTPAEAPCSARFTAYENGELKSENRGLRPDPPRGP
jgi:hypothetical protein